jgi:dTDP-4-dehydrorhamnose reductase
MKKLLITGISGFLGWHIGQIEQEDWDITGLYHQHKPNLPKLKTQALDLCDEAATQRLLKRLKPDAILHLAALSNPNFCEENPSLSQELNVESTVLLAEYAATQKIPFLFTSTDLVFDGTKGNYSEEDQPSPINRYGLHKAVAENKVQESYPNATIIRLPLMYGLTESLNNFMANWLEKWKAGETIPAFSDEFRSPISGMDAARGLFFLLKKEVSGIWHLAGAERFSRYTMAMRMADSFDFDLKLITESLQSDVQMAAARPADVSLNIEKIQSIGFDPKPLSDQLEQIKARLNS